jgi:hypothetical protein
MCGMEDIDPPREVPGADRLHLAKHLSGTRCIGDGEVLYQSTRHVRYKDVFSWGWLHAIWCIAAVVPAPVWPVWAGTTMVSVDTTRLPLMRRAPGESRSATYPEGEVVSSDVHAGGPDSGDYR